MISNPRLLMVTVLNLRRKESGSHIMVQSYRWGTIMFIIQALVLMDQLTGFLATKPTFCGYYLSHMKEAVYSCVSKLRTWLSASW